MISLFDRNFDSGLQLDALAWFSGITYSKYDYISNGGIRYHCIADHIASGTNEPGIGIDWATYWEIGAAHFDTKSSYYISMEMVFDAIPTAGAYTAEELLDLTMQFTASTDLSGVVALDLLSLIPDKFHKSQLLLDYVSSINIEIGKWVNAIDGLVLLKDPYSVGRDYIGQLSNLIGLKFLGEDTATLSNLRQQLLGAIDWFKVKGTYTALSYVAGLNNFTINLLDMYTNDYVNFVTVPWFVASYEEENPPGLDASYYKSPHFGFEIVFDRIYGTGVSAYLWKDIMLGNIPETIEMVRPINTVPHLYGTVLGQAHEDGIVDSITLTGVNTVTTSNWSYTALYFNNFWNFDEGFDFDTDRSTFIASITMLHIGTGHRGDLPTTIGFALETEVYSCLITRVTYSASLIVFEIDLPLMMAQTGLSELVLTDAGGVIMVAATFPIVDKTANMQLKIQIEVRATP